VYKVKKLKKRPWPNKELYSHNNNNNNNNNNNSDNRNVTHKEAEKKLKYKNYA
jgi:hypothetical protein